MADLKIGMIGLDTSHCTAFASLLNSPDAPRHVAGGRIVAAFPGGSQAFSLSRQRVGKYTEEMAGKYGVKIYDSIPAMADDVDVIMLESVDGRQHLEQFRQIVSAGKRVFIDKPLACSAGEARQIAELAAANGVDILSCSSLRFAAGIRELHDAGEALSCEAFGPASILGDYPGLFWYGIHSAEVLFSFLGAGCRSVRTIVGGEIDLVVGQWSDGRIGTLRGFRREGLGQFGCAVVTESGVQLGTVKKDAPLSATLLAEIMRFFQTGKSPVDMAETLEIMAFLDTADRSRCQDGRDISLS